MAIPFLNNIDLRNNELWNVRLQNTGSANTNPGQIYFDTGDNIAKYYSSPTDTWVSLKEYSFSNGTFVSLSSTGTTAKPIITAELSATGTPSTSTFLRGDNTWATVVQENDFLTNLSFDTNNGRLTATVQNQSDVTVDLDDRYALASDIPATIVESVTGGTYITNSGTASDVILDHDATSRTDTTSIDAPSYNSTFEAVTSVTTNATGHVTAIDVSTITLPEVADGVLDVDNFNASAIVIESEGIENNDNDTTLPTSAAVKAYVDASIVGGLVYQGGYNADTNTPDLTTSPNSIKKGWTYTVTAAGTFSDEKLEVGDVLIAEVDNPSSIGDWTTVQNNVDLATDSTVGIGNVNAGTGIDVSYNAGTATVSLTAVAPTSGSISVPNSATYTYPDDIEASSTNNVLIQLVDSNGETVYADVQRLSTTTFSVNYGVTTPTGVIALIQLIG
jgi:hypothetical protein